MGTGPRGVGRAHKKGRAGSRRPALPCDTTSCAYSTTTSALPPSAQPSVLFESTRPVVGSPYSSVSVHMLLPQSPSKMNLYSYGVALGARSYRRWNVSVKKSTPGVHGEDWNSPAIVICEMVSGLSSPSGTM